MIVWCLATVRTHVGECGQCPSCATHRAGILGAQYGQQLQHLAGCSNRCAEWLQEKKNLSDKYYFPFVLYISDHCTRRLLKQSDDGNKREYIVVYK